MKKLIDYLQAMAKTRKDIIDRIFLSLSQIVKKSPLTILAVFVGVIIGIILGLFLVRLNQYLLSGLGRSPENALIIFFLSTLTIWTTVSIAMNWRALDEKPEKKVGICAQILSICIASIMGFVVLKTNRDDTRCLNILQRKDAMIEVLRKVTHGVQVEIGVPENCYDSKGGTQPFHADEKHANLHNEYVLNLRILVGKSEALFALVGNEELARAWKNYLEQRFKLESKCGNKDGEFHDTWRLVTQAEINLIEEVNNSIAHCYQQL